MRVNKKAQIPTFWATWEDDMEVALAAEVLRRFYFGGKHLACTGEGFHALGDDGVWRRLDRDILRLQAYEVLISIYNGRNGAAELERLRKIRKDRTRGRSLNSLVNTAVSIMGKLTGISFAEMDMLMREPEDD